MEVLAAKCAIAGLNDEISCRLVADAIHQARLIGAAHLFFKAMCEDEAAIRRLIRRRADTLDLALLVVGALMVLPLVGIDDDATSLAVGLSLAVGCFELVIDEADLFAALARPRSPVRHQ